MRTRTLKHWRWLMVGHVFHILCVATLTLLGPLTLGAQTPAGTPFLLRPAAPHVRVMTWNIGANSIFDDPGPRGYGNSDGGRPARFRRLLKAIKPDVVCLQEVFAPRNAADVARLLDEVLPLGESRYWQAYGRPDIVIASRFPLSMLNARTEDWSGGVSRTHAMALVNLPAALGETDLYAICAHAQSRSAPKDVLARQEQADAIAAWVRDLRTPGGEVDLPARTPMVLLGDWNAYKTDPAGHITTLLTGEIVNRKRFGPGGPPDWDDSPLRDAHPLHNASGAATYTFGDGSPIPYPPAALDRILFTDSVLNMLSGFVLNTTTLKPAVLSRFNLRSDDVLLNSTGRVFDHLPVVVDLALRRPVHHAPKRSGRHTSAPPPNSSSGAASITEKSERLRPE